MKAYFKKIAALTAAALLVFSMAACGGNDDTESTAPVDDTNSVVEDIPADDTNASNEDVSGESDTAASNDTSDTAKTEEGGDKTPTSSSSNSDTLSKDEAVALFNKATAAAKSKSGNRYTKVDLVEVPGGAILSGALSPLLPKPDKATAIKGVPNGTMNASDFSSVTAKKSGNNWVLTMNVKTETAPNTAANSRAFEELPQSEIDKALGSLSVSPMSGVKFTYSGGTINATVTADGQLVSATYTMKVQLVASNVTAVGGFVKISSAKVNITQTDKF